MFSQRYYLYILANKRNNVLYVGVTNNIWRRLGEHRGEGGSRFVKKYRLTRLVYIEEFDHAYDAICREKQLKGGSRQKKIDLIRSSNPYWDDLSSRLF